MSDSRFIELMTTAIAATDGTEAEALEMFELQLLELGDPQEVWDLFEPVRLTVLRRLYGMAKHQADQASEAQPNAQTSSIPLSGAASEPDETADSSVTRKPFLAARQHSAVSTLASRRTTVRSAARSPRGARSAQDVLISIGGKKSHLDWLTNHRGIPIGDLTYAGLENSHDEAPLFQRFAHRLMGSGIPKTGRSGDIVRRFITPDEADRMWLDLMKEVA